MTQCEFCARFLALRAAAPEVKHRMPPNQIPNTGTTCGCPFGLTVASQ
jgi:hypothetical protein